MSMSKPLPTPGKAQGSTPVASAPKKRKLPDFGHEESSLTESSSRAVVEQYLAQRPERLGAILKRMERHKREAAIKSLQVSDVLRTSTRYEHGIAPSDKIAIVSYHDSAADMDYAVLSASELPDEVVGVLTFWYNSWVDSFDTAAKRSGNIEHDGSAQLCTDDELDDLSDAIEAYVDDLADKQCSPGDIEEEYDDAYEEEFNHDEKSENIHENLKEFFVSASWVKIEPRETRALYTLSPKITIRYQCDP